MMRLLYCIFVLTFICSVFVSTPVAAQNKIDKVNIYDTKQQVEELTDFIKEVNQYIESISLTKQKYEMTMAPSQKMVAQCKAISPKMVKHPTAKYLLEKSCNKVKKQTELYLFQVGRLLDESSDTEKRMLEQVDIIIRILDVDNVINDFKAPLEELHQEVKKLQDLKKRIEKELLVM